MTRQSEKYSTQLTYRPSRNIRNSMSAAYNTKQHNPIVSNTGNYINNMPFKIKPKLPKLAQLTLVD